jgi:hypothetical protein
VLDFEQIVAAKLELAPARTVVAGLALWVLIVLAEARGWRHVLLDPSPPMALVLLAPTVPTFLVTWRIARRFGGRFAGFYWLMDRRPRTPPRKK